MATLFQIIKANQDMSVQKTSFLNNVNLHSTIGTLYRSIKLLNTNSRDTPPLHTHFNMLIIKRWLHL